MLEGSILALLLVVALIVAVLAVVLAGAARRRRRVTGPGDGAVTEAEPALPTTRLPPGVTELVGRDAELDRLRAARPGAGAGSGVGPGAGPGPVWVISGRAGVGKTALAVRVAEELRAEFPDGELYLDLHGSRPSRLGPADAFSALLHALGAGGQANQGGVDAQSARLRSLLAGKRVLLLLDDAADADQVRPLLPDGPGCLTLVTSREPLADLPGASPLPLAPLSEPQAVTLLAEMVGRRRVSRDPVAAATAARGCDQLPLALRIVGARLRTRLTMPLVTAADQLIHERLRLNGQGAAEPGVAASVSVSYALLAEEDARLFRRLALLPGPDFAAPAAAAVMIVPPAEAERGLERLATAQLLERLGAGRYRFHDAVRQSALERLDADETVSSRRAARRRALSSYLAQVRANSERVGSLRPGTEEFPRQEAGSRRQQAAALTWFERERLNLAAAVRLAAETAEPHIAWRLAANLAVFLDIRGYTREWVELAEEALLAARAGGDPYAVAVALHDLGDAHRRQGHFSAATAFLTESSRAFAALESPQDEARVLVTLGRLHQESRKLVAAVDDFRRALAIFRAYGLRRDEIEVFTALGVVRRLQGRLEEAVVFLEEARDLVRTIGSGRLVDDLTAAEATSNLGMVCLAQGKVAEAAAYHTESLATFREIGDRRAQAHALRNLGECERQAGRPAEAARYLDESLALFEALDDRAGQGEAWGSIGRLHADAGRWAEAAAAYDRAVVAFREVGAAAEEGLARFHAGRALLRAGDAKAATEALREAEPILTELRAPEAKEARLVLAELTEPDELDEA